MQQTVMGNIKSQPEVLLRVLKNRQEFTGPFVRLFREHDIRRIYFFGSGTSYNVSHIASYYFKHILGIEGIAQYPTVFSNYEKADWPGLLRNDQILFVGISQSGTSVSTCQVMEQARKNGYPTLALTGNPDSQITKQADLTVPLLVGEELTPPETKGYTVSVITAYLWAVETAFDKGVYTKEQYEAAITEVKSLLENFHTVIAESEAWFDRNQASIVSSDRLYVLGYGIDYGSMLEGMLKVGEMLRLPTIGYEIEEFTHGPTMALRKNQTILMIGSDEAEYNRMLKFREAFLKYTRRVHVITCRGFDDGPGDLVFSHKANKYIAPLMYTVPFQITAAAGAKRLYIDTNENPFRESLAHYPD